MSALARITDSLAVRGHIGVVLMVADLALTRLADSAGLPVARAAFDLWFDGERFDPNRFGQAYADEDGRDLAGGAMNARSQCDTPERWVACRLYPC